MYKCSECGKQYDIKPDFCDCGNDEFISEEKAVIHKPKPEPTPIITENQTKWLRENGLSLIIFLILVILSIVILLIKVSDNIETEEKPTVAQNQPAKAVNWALFEDTETVKPVVKSENVKPEPKQEIKKEIKKTAPVEKPVVKKEAKQTQKPVTKYTEKKVSKPVSKPVQKATAKNTAASVSKPVTTAATTTKPVDTEKILNSYKKSIANVFYYKIDFTNIIGNGFCIVTFSVDGNGNIRNKAFSQPSSNTTLNDAVFDGVKSVTRVSVPPDCYKGTTLKLYVEINNGSYAISVK